MKNIATTNLQIPSLWNLIKIYWSIVWRANVLTLTSAVIFFGLFSIALDLLIKTNNFDVFREYFFAILPFPGNEPLIVYPTLFMRIYTDTWSFIWSYCLYFYGFKRILKLNLYPAFLQDTMTFKDYSNVFLIPTAIYSFIDPAYFGTIDYISSIILHLIITLFYYYILFTNLRKLATPGNG